jgi:hypothetical protein
MLTVIGLLGGILSLASNIPYIYDTLKKKTQPHRVTWGIFFLLNVIFLGNQLAAGATNSIWLVVAFTLSTCTVFMLSLRNGVGGSTKLDIVVLIGALSGVVIWQILDSPLASIIANLVVALIASIPTYKKAWRVPETETKISYSVGAFAAFLSAVSIGKFDIVLLLLPIYSILYQGTIFLILIRHKLHLRKY